MESSPGSSPLPEPQPSPPSILSPQSSPISLATQTSSTYSVQSSDDDHQKSSTSDDDRHSSSSSSSFGATPPSSPVREDNNDSPPRKLSKTWKVNSVLPSRSTIRLQTLAGKSIEINCNTNLENSPSVSMGTCSSASSIHSNSSLPSSSRNASVRDDESGSVDFDEDVAQVNAITSEDSSDSDVSSIEGGLGNLESDDEDVPVSLYNNTNKTVNEAVLDIFMNHLKNRETKNSLKDHLDMFLKYLPQPNNMPQNVKALYKFLKTNAPSFSEKAEKYCASCLLYLGNSFGPCEACASESTKFFYSFNIEHQLKHYFEQSNMADIIDKYQQSLQVSGDCIQDICDGSEYKRLKINCGKYNIALMWSTDGVQVSSSSNLSFYPVQAVICEVPPHLRQKFILVSVLWCDYAKPPMSTLLSPFVSNLNEIAKVGGVTWKHPVNKDIYQSSVIAPLASVDAPVRADLQNIKSHNSKYACNICEQKSVKIPLNADYLELRAAQQRVHRLRRFVFQETRAKLRDHHRMLRQARSAVRFGRDIKGVKGPSIVELLPSLDLSTFVFPEYMHNVCLGIVRHFLNLWMKVTGPWFIGNQIDAIDSLMKEIKAPGTVGRQPRAVSTFERWKASELRSWLLFYSLPVLRNVLPPNYIQHWMLLVMAIFALLKEKITSQDIEMAETLLNIFVRDVGILYRERDYVYNVHELLHLPLCVKRWGPLWATSAFLFENMNGVLTRLIHGTKHHAKELSNNLVLAFGIQILQKKVLNSCHECPSSIEPLGSFNLTVVSEQEKNFLVSIGACLAESTGFTRVKFNRQVFTSKMYKQEKKGNNYTVYYQHNEVSSYGEILFFIQMGGEGQEVAVYAVVNRFRTEHTKIFFHQASRLKVAHIVPINPQDSAGVTTIVPVTAIGEKVVRVANCVCRLPNKFEARNL